MTAPDQLPVCVHTWRLTRAVLGGEGATRTHVCEECGAEAVEPASGDRL